MCAGAVRLFRRTQARRAACAPARGCVVRLSLCDVAGEGERKEDLYARGIAETAGDGRTGAGFPPGPSGGGDSGSRGGGVGAPRGADRAGGGAGGPAAGRRGGAARVHRTARRGAARAAESAAQVSVRGWQGGGEG